MNSSKLPLCMSSKLYLSFQVQVGGRGAGHCNFGYSHALYVHMTNSPPPPHPYLLMKHCVCKTDNDIIIMQVNSSKFVYVDLLKRVVNSLSMQVY